MTWAEKTEYLKKELTFRRLFETISLDREKTCAVWLEGQEEKSYTYGFQEDAVYATAAHIRELSFGTSGGWTGIAVDTCKEWPILFWALLCAGRNCLLLDPSLDDAGIDRLMKQAGATSLITRRKRDLPYEQKAPEEIVSYKKSGDFTPEWADMISVCTSGTTGTSRVFVYNGEAMCQQIFSFLVHQEYPCFIHEGAGSIRMLGFLPLNHILGLVTSVITGPFEGYQLVYLRDRAPQTIMETCRLCRVQLIITVPLLVNSIAATIDKTVEAQSAVKRAAYHLMQGISLTCQRINPRFGLRVAKKLFHSINQKIFGDSMLFLIVGGSHVSEGPFRTVNALGYAAGGGFGMTETGITAYGNNVKLYARLNCGVFPLVTSECKVVPNGKDKNTGELLIRCNYMHVGRMENGKLIPPDVDEDGYFHSGDIVHFGKHGQMWVVGRVKDVIIGESGENIYPDEIEDTFTDMEGVKQMTVVGVKEGKTEAVTLVLNVGEKITDEAFLSSLAAQVGERNKKLRSLSQATLILATDEEFPMVNSIKVKRAEISARIAKGQMRVKKLDASVSAEPEEPRQTAEIASGSDEDRELKEMIRTCFAEELHVDPSLIKDNSTFTDNLDIDSLNRLGALIRVENQLGIQIPEEEYGKCTSINSLVKVIKAIQNGESTEKTEQGEVTPITRFEDSPEYKDFAKRFEDLGDGENPYFICHESPLRDTSVVDGKEVLNFGSYNYVGMSGRKEVNEAAKAAIDKYGTSASGSRLLAGEKKVHEELEHAIAEWKHAEDCVVLVGGHSTNVTVVGNFCQKGDLILYDALIHNSVHEGCRLSDADTKAFPHNDFRMLESILKNLRNKYAKVLIVVEGVYSMDGDISPIPEFVRIKKQYGCFLMVDEAHSTCVIGETGGGVDEYFGLQPNDIDIKMGTLSKGLGTCGGYIAGSHTIVEYLRYNVPGFVFSVGLSPALAAGSLAAVRLMRQNPQIMADMRRNIAYFAEEAHRHHFNICLGGKTAILPVLVGRDEDAYALSNRLKELGVIVPPAVYPAVPKGKARLRFCVISEHKPEQIKKALDLLEQAAKELNIVLPE